MNTCKRAGCDTPAVSVVLTQGDYAAKPVKVEDHCRPHHAEERRLAGRVVACELLTTGVVMVDVDGTDRENRGDRIEWDADEIDVDTNVRAGFVKRLDAPSLTESLAAEEELLAERLAAVKSRKAEAAKAEKAEKAEAEKAAKAEQA